MKRTIALLAVIALLVSFVSISASATTANPPVLAGYGESHLPEVDLMVVPADMKRAEPMDAESLDEALNVPGGTLEFGTYDLEDFGIYAWVLEGDYAKSTNKGVDGTEETYGMSQSQVSTEVIMEEDQAIRFRFKVSCQNAENTDWLALYVDNTRAAAWYGEEDWTTYTYPVSAGYHEITWVYNKDGSIGEGEDTAYLDDVEVISFQSYTPVHDQKLDDALNVEGGKLKFYTPEEASNGYFPWVAENGSAKSTNNGIDAETSYSPPSISTVSTTVNAGEGEVLTFRCRVSSEEQADSLRFYMDGERLKQWSGEQDWAVYILALEPGEHVFKWNYEKDYSGSYYEDTAWLDDVRVGEPVAATGVEIQQTASVAGCRTVALTWKVLPDTAFSREVTFTSSDESIATVDENGIVTGISQGVATITVTTRDGGFTDTCLVTVTADEPPVNLYGFMYSEFVDNDRYYWHANTWCSFQDTCPGEANKIGNMPPEPGESEGALVTCAELVGDTVYGYTSKGYFFTMDFEAMQRGELNPTYKTVNVSNDNHFLPLEMAYDHSTGTMYVVNYLEVLYEVDLETGDFDLDSYRIIDGELPDDVLPGQGEYVYGFAIDLNGNAYIMLEGSGRAAGGNGCSRLASLNLETGEFTVIGQTTAECYQEQSMCFDHNSGKLYWAQWNTIYDQEIQLYIVDTQTAELEGCGRIGEYGADILGMFIPICDHSHVSPVEAKEPTCTKAGNPAYWHCEDCGKNFYDEHCIEEAPGEELVIPALGHKTELRNAKEATCTEDGYTGDEVCTICGEIMKQGEVIPAHCPSKAFADLNTDRWYHEYTDYVIARELMNGMDETHFAPEGNLTRGMLVTTLYRLAGGPEVTEKATFTDLRAGAYYADAVAWAQDLGIAKGMTETQFAPEKTVSREQTATFLYRFVTLYLEQEPGKGADLGVFKDGKVMEYAKTAMSWAVAEGFFEGYGDGTLRPTASLTRAQMAKLLTILDQNF